MPPDLAVTIGAPAAQRRALPLPGSEERLARQVTAGDERAFTRLYERYHQQLYRYSRSMTRNDADAQDALQSAFTNALVALREGRRDAPVRPWLYRIVHNEAVSLMRRRRGDVELSEAVELTGSSIEERAEERARLSALVADLHELPERQRGALLMHELNGLGHDEIAAAFGVSNGVVRQLVYEARRSLQEFAEGRAMACDEICRLISDGDRRGLRSRRVRAHLRDCAGCAAFAEAIPARQLALRAIAPPLPAAAAAGVLSRLLGGSGHAGGGGAGATTIGTSAAGKTAVVALSTKAVTGIAIVAATGVGVGTAVEHLASGPPTSRPAQVAPAASHRLTTGISVVRGATRAAPAATSGPRSRSTTGRHAATERHASGGTGAPTRGFAPASSGFTTTTPGRSAGAAQGMTAGSANGNGRALGRSNGQGNSNGKSLGVGNGNGASNGASHANGNGGNAAGGSSVTSPIATGGSANGNGKPLGHGNGGGGGTGNGSRTANTTTAPASTTPTAISTPGNGNGKPLGHGNGGGAGNGHGNGRG